MNWLHRLPIWLLVLCALNLLLGLTDATPNMTSRVKRSAAKVLLKKKGWTAATAALVAAASISKKKFLPIPIPFPLPILKPPIIEPIPVPFGKFGGIGGFGGFGGFG